MKSLRNSRSGTVLAVLGLLLVVAVAVGQPAVAGIPTNDGSANVRVESAKEIRHGGGGGDDNDHDDGSDTRYLELKDVDLRIRGDSPKLDVSIRTAGRIPLHGGAGAFGYAIMTDGLNNVLVLVTHLGIVDSEFVGKGGFHTHVLDLMAASEDCGGFDAEVDLVGSGENDAFDPNYRFHVGGRSAGIRKVPMSDLGDATVEMTASFTVTPVFSDDTLTNLCVDVVDTFPSAFVTPIFGLAAAPGGSLLVADAGAGIFEWRNGKVDLIAELPGVTDVAPIGHGEMLAVTGIGEGEFAGKLFRVSRGSVRMIADLTAFEAEVNPDGGHIESNPFDVAALSKGRALVADAAGNSLLIVDRRGHVDWVASLPSEMASTANAKALAGCPDGPPDICELPDEIPAEPVATSVAVGPDGAYYVGELKGFPAPTGMSRVWRIEPDARHAECGTSPSCSVVLEGFTSIVDLAFDRHGMLYVVELDEASWLAVELGATIGGTVNACESDTWTCTEIATDIPLPIAVAITRDGDVYAAILVLVPGEAQVVRLVDENNHDGDDEDDD